MEASALFSSGSSSSSSSSFASSLGSSSPLEQWQCPYCTLDNANSTNTCLACAMPRPAESKPKTSRPHLKIEVNHPSCVFSSSRMMNLLNLCIHQSFL